jgi:5'-deoxynucleotidase YfbR-like HD superfamily hydrolase
MIGNKLEKNGWSDIMQDKDEAEAVRLDTRLAGQLRRYHTWPIMGQQTTAEHSWQIMRIYLSVVEVPDAHMVRHIMFHDIGEHYTGDIPYPVKKDNPILKEHMDFLEHKSYCDQLSYWGAFQQTRLNEEEKKLFKQIELIEMAEFGMDQMNLGSWHGQIIADRCLRAVYENQPHKRLTRYVAKRLLIFYEQCHPSDHCCQEVEWWWIRSWEKFHVKSESDTGGGNPLPE